MVYITAIGTFVAAFILKQFWSQPCDLKQAETRLEMKQTLGVLPHGAPLDTYWGGVTCLGMGEERQKKSQADSSEAEMQLTKSIIVRVGEWQGIRKRVADMNRQIYFMWADIDALIWKHCEADLLSALFSRRTMLTFIRLLWLPL